jgi:tRNA(Ile)-lysidine synthase
VPRIRETPLSEALRRSLADHPTPRVWIAYSGGRDSTALLHATARLLNPASARQRPPSSPALSAIHVDHGIHADAPAWAEHCRRYCAALGVPLRVRSLRIARAPGQSLEEIARAARWSVWEELLARDEQLWLAQHRDDQAETLLLALLRGAGIQGLAGIPPWRTLGAGLAGRPWLDCAAALIDAYAEAHGLDWIEDPSNQNTAFDRNLLRQRILPALRERWPAATTTIARSAGHCAEAASLLADASAHWLAAARGRAPGTLSIKALQALSSAQRHAVLRHWLARQGFRMPSQRRLARVSEMLDARADAAPLLTWAGCELRRYRDGLFALAPLPAPPALDLTWNPAQPLDLGGHLGELSLPTTALHGALEPAPWRVRFGVTGLRCRPRREGPSRRLKALFQQQGVPAWLRPYVPLVFAGERLIAVAGVALCDERLPALRWRQGLIAGAGLVEMLGDAAAFDADQPPGAASLNIQSLGTQ